MENINDWIEIIYKILAILLLGIVSFNYVVKDKQPTKMQMLIIIIAFIH